MENTKKDKEKTVETLNDKITALQREKEKMLREHY